ncbi:hypothetical protein FDI90_gp123 [Pseudomonas phage PA7]|uniref:PHIKZ236 n=3 Tax=root TaxID=1 RepID=Q8SCS6_BPDPK|nr:PHIKZ236 [Pseudomonas phage phiKZ]YP_009617411.1 hypothetical protein FDI90_gp123 [Pseudomonas phage PA7]MBG7006608.1 hypothetical protein [Pseudomonas aeruginosa]QGK89914.1 hypothetical protein [Pseudomonas phage vB_PA32_GUMS]QOV08131.1 hypothetical protein [Pseudomonas phage vB_PaeM_kmuB]WPJ69403.1 hypothetical protein PAZH1_280 [Pseudomonas phage PA_ZH1]WRQ05580.1 hypothetical protein IPCDMZAV_CDS0057 [Pseudomonas phage 6B]WRQ06077.1 hypothetical protein QAMIJHJT_CDS0146 [Pseudomonas p
MNNTELKRQLEMVIELMGVFPDPLTIGIAGNRVTKETRCSLFNGKDPGEEFSIGLGISSRKQWLKLADHALILTKPEKEPIVIPYEAICELSAPLKFEEELVSKGWFVYNLLGTSMFMYLDTGKEEKLKFEKVGG